MDEWVIHLSSRADNEGFKEDIKFCHCDLPVLRLWILKATLPDSPDLLQHSLLCQLPADALPVDPFYHQSLWKPGYYCAKWRVLMSLTVMLKCMQPCCWGEGRAAALGKELDSDGLLKINDSFLCLCVHCKSFACHSTWGCCLFSADVSTALFPSHNWVSVSALVWSTISTPCNLCLPLFLTEK